MTPYDHLVESAGTLETSDIERLITALQRLLEEREKEEEPRRDFEDIVAGLEHDFSEDPIGFLFALAQFGYVIRFESKGSGGNLATVYKARAGEADPRHACGVTRSADPYGVFDADDNLEAAVRIVAHGCVENMLQIDPKYLVKQNPGVRAVDLRRPLTWERAYEFTLESGEHCVVVQSPLRCDDIAEAIAAAENFSEIPTEDPHSDYEVIEVRECTGVFSEGTLVQWVPGAVIWARET